jgi:Flp pilus assembly protein TadG
MSSFFGRWRNRIPKRLIDESGSGTLEFALSAVILFMTMLGIMEISLALYTNHMISEAAREGTRYAMVHGNKCVVSGASCTATAAQIQSYVQNLGYPGILPQNMTVTTTYSAYPAGNTCTPNANCANPGNLVKVSVAYSFPLTIPFVPSSLLNLGSSSSMVISQ